MKIITELVFVTIIVTELISRGFCGNKPDDTSVKSKYPSHYNSQVKVDGVVREWPPESFFCNSATNVYYAAANDSSNIYLCIQVLNQAVQMSLLRSGLTFYLDPSGKKKKNCYLHLTFQSQEFSGTPWEISNKALPGEDMRPKQEFPDRRVSDNQVPLKERIAGKRFSQAPRLISIVIETNGFRDGFNGMVLPGAKFHDFAASGSVDSSGMLIIEASVPKNAFPGDSTNLKCVSLGFEITCLITPSQNRNPGGSDRGGPGGQMHGPPGGMGGGGQMGGMGGGGFGGGGMKGGGRNNESNGSGPEMGGHDRPPSGMEEQTPKSYKIWYTFSIARKP
jgi:hypothetical protein